MAGVSVRIEDLEPGDPRLASEVLPVLRQLRPHLTVESFAAVYAEGWPQGLRFTAAYDRERCLGVAGWRIQACTVAIRKLYVDDLVTAAASRSTGVGHALIADLERRARDAGCTLLDLDSGVQRFDAHRFYLRERMAITAHHFGKQLAGYPVFPSAPVESEEDGGGVDAGPRTQENRRSRAPTTPPPMSRSTPISGSADRSKESR
jgi:GNAT superfamily N-acetyltransferase